MGSATKVVLYVVIGLLVLVFGFRLAIVAVGVVPVGLIERVA